MAMPDEGLSQRRTVSEDGAASNGETENAHNAAIAAGASGYFDPLTGFFVFTRVALLANGKCCGSGCRHCPFPDESHRGSTDVAS